MYMIIFAKIDILSQDLSFQILLNKFFELTGTTPSGKPENEYQKTYIKTRFYFG